MKLVVISPERDDARETAVLGELFAAGLERYHLRKPDWSREQLAAWLRAMPVEWRARIVLHQHHELVAPFGLGGVHWRDGSAGVPPAMRLNADGTSALQPITSRSCHDLVALRAALGHYDSVFFSPVFPSLSKPGHVPRADFSPADLSTLLAHRTPAQRRTAVVALGGVTVDRLSEVRALGFDGAAVLGAIWQAADPSSAFTELQRVCPGRDGRPARPLTVAAVPLPKRTRGPRVPTSSPHAA